MWGMGGKFIHLWLPAGGFTSLVALEVQSPIARTWDNVTSEAQTPGRSKAQSHTNLPHFSKLLFLQLLT